MLLNNSFSIFFTVFSFDYFLRKSVTSVGQNIRDKVHILEEDVLEPQYRETDRLLSVRNYALEDFFWTGSGDGPPPPDPSVSWAPSSVATTTLLATIFIESPPNNGNPPSSEEEDCVSECPISPYDGSSINPTRPGQGKPSTPPPDQRYWLLTVLQAPAVALPQNLDVRLAKLYKTAFSRQQDEHLGIIPTVSSVFKTNNIKSFKSDTKPLHNLTDDFTIVTKKVYNAATGNSETDTEDFAFLNDESLSQNNFTETPFEYITNLFEITTIGIPRKLLRRSVINNQEDGGNITKEIVPPTDSVEVVKRQIQNQQNVEVFLYNVTRDSKAELKVIYWVSVGGHPVPALTAARDMRLMADAEVVAELGYPITTKAEPYLKSPEHLNGVSRVNDTQDTWLIFGGTILAILLLLVMVIFLVCRLAYKRKSSASGKAMAARPNIESKGVQYPSEGKDNVGYTQEDGKLISVVTPSKKKLNVSKTEQQDGLTRRYVRGPHYKVNRVGSSDSSSSSSSGSDLSQMNAALRQRQKLFEEQIHNEYSTINKKSKSKHRKIRSKKVGVANTPHPSSPVEIRGDGTLQRFLVSDPPSPSVSSSDAISALEDNVPIRRPTGPVSPTSYLSMPSVKSFPRSNVVEPLCKVLEPLSVRHLDMDSPVHQYGSLKHQHTREYSETTTSQDDKIHASERKQPQVQRSVTPKLSPHFVRLGSMDKDPGIIGPMVWDLHNQRLRDSKINSTEDSGANMSRMRQRFTELVDDAFSLFGSGYNTPKSVNNTERKDEKLSDKKTPTEKTVQDYHLDKLHFMKVTDPIGVHGGPDQRPLTALPPRPPLPKQISAWESAPGISMSRSTSAGGIQRRPIVDTARVNSEGFLSAADPALPLLQAIRNELNKLPGTSDA